MEDPSLPKPITRAGRPWRMSPRSRRTASVEKTTDWPTRKSSGAFSGERATEMTGQGSLSSSAYRRWPFSVSSMTPRI